MIAKRCPAGSDMIERGVPGDAYEHLRIAGRWSMCGRRLGSRATVGSVVPLTSMCPTSCSLACFHGSPFASDRTNS